jgi:hypothetical protein
MQLELYGTSEPILSSKLYRKSFSELFQELLTNFNSQSQNFNAEFKFISVIQSFNFITLKAREHYEPRSGSSTYIVVFTEIHPRLMKKGGKYKMIYDFVSNETKPDLQAHLALVKANCGQEAYRKEFLERVEQLVSENKKSYFKVDRNGSEVTIVECPTIDAHGSCVTTKMNDDMEVKWFYQKPEEDDFTGPLIAYYNNNEGRTHFKQPNIIESWPEEDSSKRRKLH